MSASTESPKIQIVWDSGSECTAQAPSGHHLHVGPGAEWSPEQLLLAAAESSLMTAFVALAKERGLEVLGYVSSAGLATPRHRGQRVQLVLRPCVMIGRETDRALVHELFAKAHEASPVARALGRSMRLAPEVVLLLPEDPTS